MRPKLLAIEVGGCHLIPVILRALAVAPGKGGRGHGERDMTQPQDPGRVATGNSFRSITQTDIALGRTLLMLVPLNT